MCVVFIPGTGTYSSPDRRAEIANNAKADLFISIHTNAPAKTGRLKEPHLDTGLAKSDANLKSLNRENAVIL